jgi:hypothetical protein
MDFRDYAATQTSELVTRLLADSSSHSRLQLARLRAALDEAIATIETAPEAAPSRDRDVAELVDQLARAAAASAGEQAARELQPLRAELAAHADEVTLLAGSLEEAQGQLDALRNDLDTAREEASTARARADALAADLEAARAQLEEAHADRLRFEETAAAATSQAEAAEAKLEAVTALFKTSNSRVRALERAQEEHERAVRGLQAKLSSQGTSSDGEVGVVPVLDELLGSFEALSAATSITDVLTTLTEQLAGDFSRVALFRVKGNRLEGEHQIGLDLPADVGKVVMPLGMDSLLTRAASAGELLRLAGSELADSSRAPFAGSPSCALALPIVVNAETLAVVYADDSGQAESERAPIDLERSARVADALGRHTVALITRLSSELKALAELRAYADLLLKEMEQMYTADVEAGQSGQTLMNLLKSNLEYARSIYASRVAHEGADAATLLEDQISLAIDTQADTPFGRDLAVALGHTDVELSERASAGA